MDADRGPGPPCAQADARFRVRFGHRLFSTGVIFFLFALTGGSLADRVDKRQLLLITQSISAALAILLGALTWFGVIQVWMIVALAFGNGAVLSFDQPARGALVPSLVPDEHLTNAISLQSMVFNGASMLGPALAGVSLHLLGYAGNFFLNGASYLGVLIALFAMRVRPTERRPENALAAIRTALRFVRHDSVLPWVLSGYATLLFFGPSPALVLPVYAVNVLHLGPERLGLLFSCVGAGTILGAVTLASLSGDTRGLRRDSAANRQWRNRMGTICGASCCRRMTVGKEPGATGRALLGERALGVEDLRPTQT